MAADWGPLERATRAELRGLRISVQTHPLAATMVSLARLIDSSRGAAAAAMAAQQLRETRRVLLEEASEHDSGDVVDEVNAQRAKRRAEAEDLDGSVVGVQRGRPGPADSGPGGPAS